MLIINARPTAVRANSAPQPAPEQPRERPDVVDAFARGATGGGNLANSLIGAWNGGLVGLVGGAAAGAGSSVYAAVTNASSLNWDTALSTLGRAGVWAGVGGVAGAVVGGYVLNKVGDFAGNLCADICAKNNLPAEVGRAVGTVGTGVAVGALVGLGVAGYSGATVALVAGGVGGALGALRR
ncbi:MAG: hypothetical protein AB7S38_20765 [Vulcanimicrobiota bacterium]